MTDRLIPYDLGTTALADELPHLLGHQAIFTDADKDSTGAKAMLTGLPIVALWVKNSASATLAAGDVVTWSAGYAGTRVGAKCGSLAKGAGVVDPYVGSAGVTDGRHFWLIVKGPCDLKGDGTSISAGNALTTDNGSATGYVQPYASGAEQAVARCGIALENCAAVAATKFRALVDFTY